MHVAVDLTTGLCNLVKLQAPLATAYLLTLREVQGLCGLATFPHEHQPMLLHMLLLCFQAQEFVAHVFWFAAQRNMWLGKQVDRMLRSTYRSGSCKSGCQCMR
ncbi:hypothetical protein ABBQ32_000274 [Trebouxia sp. C0010 RCD-2024]